MEERREEAASFIPEIFAELGPDRGVEEFLEYIVRTTGNTEKQWENVLVQLGKVDFGEFSERNVRQFLWTVRVLAEAMSQQVQSMFINTVDCVYKNVVSKVGVGMFQEFILELVSNEWTPVQMAGFLLMEKIELPNEQLLNIFATKPVACEVSVGVIRSAASVLPRLDESTAHDLFDIIVKFADEEATSIVWWVPVFVAAYVSKIGDVEPVLEVCGQLLKHTNWRVRHQLASILPGLCAHSGELTDSLVDMMLVLAKDTTVDVRAVLADNVKSLSAAKQVTAEQLVQVIETLLIEANALMKASIARQMPSFRSRVSDDFISLTLLTLSKDDGDGVGASASAALVAFSEPMTAIDDVGGILKSAKDWRERLGIAMVIPKVLAKTSDNEPLLKDLLFDDSFEVRGVMIRALPYLFSELGDQWKSNILVPLLKSASEHSNYQIRQMSIYAVSELGDFSPEEVAILSLAARDPVANVRLTVASLLPRSEVDILCLLQNDADPDVKEFANRSSAGRMHSLFRHSS